MEIDPNLATLAIGIGTAIAAAIAYLRKPPRTSGAGDDIQIVGGSLSDRESMRMLADALNRVADGIEAYNQAAHDQGIRDKALEDYNKRRPSRT